MEKITVIYTYYNNPQAIDDIITLYENLSDNVEVLIVNDASTLSIPPLPSHWKHYLIQEDIGWNAEGARNLAMHVTHTKWNAMTDLDNVFCPNSLEKLPHMVGDLDKDTAYNPVRESDGKRKNSYVVHKDFYWKCNGYDETYTGLYGYDRTFTAAIRKHGTLGLLEDIKTIGKPGASKGVSRDSSEYDALHAAIVAGEVQPTDERLRFPWTRLQ